MTTAPLQPLENQRSPMAQAVSANSDAGRMLRILGGRTSQAVRSSTDGCVNAGQIGLLLAALSIEDPLEGREKRDG